MKPQEDARPPVDKIAQSLSSIRSAKFVSQKEVSPAGNAASRLISTKEVNFAANKPSILKTPEISRAPQKLVAPAAVVRDVLAVKAPRAVAPALETGRSAQKQMLPV